MLRVAGWLLVSIGVLHLLMFGADALPALDSWSKLDLWTMEHTTTPVAERSFAFLRSEHAFWTTIASPAIPLMILGALVLWMARRRLEVPAFVGWAVLAWGVACSLIMEPSGFPLFIAVGVLLLIGAHQSRRDAGDPRSR